MFGYHPGMFWTVCWRFVTPGLLIVSLKAKYCRNGAHVILKLKKKHYYIFGYIIMYPSRVETRMPLWSAS